MDFVQMIEALWRQRRRFFKVLGIVLALTTIATIVWPRTYVGEAVLVVDTKGIDPLTGNAVPGELLPNAISTQLEVITSKSVAFKVIDRFHLTDDPEVKEKFRSGTDGEGSIREWLAIKMIGK